MSTALAVVDAADHLDALPEMTLVEAQVRHAVTLGEKELLSDAAKRSEAQALYENRRGYLDREAHFARLRVICEAGIGVIACDDAEEGKPPRVSREWLVYASLFERGVLLDELLKYEPRRNGNGYARFAGSMEVRGYYWVPGKKIGASEAMPWWKARSRALEAGIALEKLPPDPREYELRSSRTLSAHARLRERQQKVMAEFSRAEKQKLIAAEAKKRSPRLDEGYRLLRKTLGALQAVYDEGLSPAERRALKDALHYLGAAEDSIAALLKVGKKS